MAELNTTPTPSAPRPEMTMTTTTEETWLDVMDAVELPEHGGIRVCRRETSTTGRPFTDRGILVSIENPDVDPELGTPVAWVLWDGRDVQEEEDASTLLPDLDDPRGFGLTLTRTTDGVTPANLGIFDRWATGNTTDADRLAVARSCAVKR